MEGGYQSMSTQVDNRVVSMQFDNKRFESNVATSMNTLDKLKHSLKLDGATKGLENVDKAAKNVDMSGLSKAVDTIQSRFSTLGIMGVTALTNITNSAVNAGKRIVSALTIDPVRTGLSEYETQINSIQTILANTESKGSTLQDVNSALAELNTYADKTIYNFTEMTRNIGTFTAAGVDLDTSVAAIKGIANLAAVSGSTSQQASTAMYQLSQALSSGTVRLMDWNSVVNAGMGGQVFQDALKETARVHGTNIDAIIKKQGSFRESLKEGWLTSEILTETLSKFTGDLSRDQLKQMGYTEKQIEGILKMGQTANDAATKVKTFSQLFETLKESAQSGWTKTWEIIIGDFGEAKEFLTDISNTLGGIIGDSADARNALLSGGLSSGWKQLLNAGIADEEGFKETLNNISKKNGFDFAKLITETEKNGGDYQDALKKALADGSITADTLSESVSTLSAKMQKMSAREREAAGYTAAHVEQIKKLDAGLKDGSISMDEFVKKISRQSGRENLIEALKNAFEGLMSVIKPIKEAFREIFPAMTGEQLYEITARIRDFTAQFKISDETAAKLKETFKGIFSAISMVVDVFKGLGRIASTVAASLFGVSGGILDLTAKLGNFITGLRNSIKNSNALNKVVETLSKFISSIVGSLSKFGSSALSSIGKTLSSIANAIKNIVSQVFGALASALESGNLERIMDVLNKGLLSMVLINIKGFIKHLRKGGSLMDTINKFISNIDNVVGKISGILDSVRQCFEVWQQNLKATILLKIASAIGILALSLVGLSGIDEGSLKRSLSAVTTLFVDLIAAMKILGRSSMSGTLSTIGTIIAMSIAINILAGALKKIASLSGGELFKGIIAIAALSKLMANVINSIATSSQRAVKGALGIVAFGAAIKILASTVIDLADLSWGDMIKGLVGVGALLAGIVVFTKKIKGDIAGMIPTALGLVAIGGAIKVLASSVKDFSNMGYEELAKGLLSVSAIMLVFTKTANKLSGTTKLISASLAFVVMGLALKQIVPVFQGLAAISVGGLVKSVLAISAVLKIITNVMTQMNKGSMWGMIENLGNVGAIEVMVDMLSILADALAKFEKISVGALAKGIVSIALMLEILVKVTEQMRDESELTILSFALALIVMAGAIKLISSVGIVGAAVTLVVLAGTIQILGHAAKVINPHIKTLLKLAGTLAALSGSFILFGVSVAVIGTALTTFLTAFAIALLGFKVLDIGTIAKGLLTLVGVLVILGTAAKTLRPLTKSILALSLSLFTLGLAVASFGLGMNAVVASFSGLAAIGVEGARAAGEALKILVKSALELIPIAIRQIGLGLIEILKVIRDCAPIIAEALIAIVRMLVDVLKTCAVDIASGFLELIVTTLQMLVNYVPLIVDLVFDFIISILNKLAERTPELIKSVVNLIMSILQGCIDALKNVDTKTLVEGIKAVGLISAIIIALAAVAVATPLAMIGVLGMFAVVTELAVVLAAIGALAQIPGLSWLVKEGGNFLQVVGTAIGQFIGGLIGGFAQGMTSTLPQIGTDLALFMKNVKPFIDGAKMIDPAVIKGVATLAGIVVVLTAASFIERINSWITGGSSLASFGAELAKFGPYMKKFSDSIVGIDNEAIVASANAAKALTELANNIPNTGGLAALFAGDNNLADFALQLLPFAESMQEYSKAIAGLDADSVTNSTNAAKSLVELANNLPNTGGLVALFTGDNTLSMFGRQLVPFAKGMKEYSDTITDDGGIDSDAVTASANAAKTLAELANNLPNSGGLVALFTGDNTLGMFGSQLVPFGIGMKAYSDVITEGDGFNSDAVVASVNAAKALCELSDNLPNSGGVVSWFVGNNDLDDFGEQLILFGKGMRSYSDAITEGDGFNVDAVVASTNAAKTLVALANNLPNSGGLVALFTGDNTLADFALQLVLFGKGMRSYSDAITEGDGFDTKAVVASTAAAQTLNALAHNLPNTGGLLQMFTGNKSLANFGLQLVPFGKGMRKYSDAITEGDGFNNLAVAASAAAAQTLVALQNNLPRTSGVLQMFTGSKSLANFGLKLIPFGKGMKSYSDAITAGDGFNPDAVIASTNAAKALAELNDHLPETGGIAGWFTGEKNLGSFGKGIVPFGEAMKSYSDAITEGNGFNPEAVESSAEAAKTLVALQNNLPKTGGLVSLFTGSNSLANFAFKLVPFGRGMKQFSDTITKDGGIDAAAVTAAGTAAESLAKVANAINANKSVLTQVKDALIGDNSLATLGNQLEPFGKGIKKFSDAVTADGGIDATAVSAAATATKSLADVAKTIYDSKGIFDDLIIYATEYVTKTESVDPLQAFIDRLPAFATAIKGYSDIITGGTNPFNIEAVKGSANALKTLADMAKTVPADTNHIKTFATNLQTFTPEIKKYFEKVAEFKDENITKSNNVIASLKEIITNFNVNSTKIKMFGSAVDMLGEYTESFVDYMSDITKKDMANALTLINSVKNTFKNIDDGTISTMQAFGDAMLELGEDSLTKFISTFKDSGKKSEAVSAMNAYLDSIVTSTKTITNKEKFKDLGIYMVDGIAAGITANKPTAVTAAEGVAAAVEAAMRSAWLINSPSKVFYRIALGVGEGIEYAFGDSILGVKRSATELADSATTGFSNTVRQIAEFINSDMDTQPTIRPVLDLSDVRAGASSIAGMFSGNRTLSISAPGVGTIAASMSNRQNGNDNLVSAINKLAKSNAKSGDTYQINGINYSEGSDVADAIQTLVRAARIEGRT